MPNFMPIYGPVVADTFYVDNALAARDVGFTLPEIVPATASVQAMGTFDIPVWQLLENMELTVTKIGIDLGMRKMFKPTPQNLEARWAQTVTDADGATKNVGCKAFVKGTPNKIPGIGIAMGEASENECTYTVTRYQLIVDGQEIFLIDRLAGIVRINGTDYAASLNNLL
jgi:P2 family phage contractile tail tube protein